MSLQKISLSLAFIESRPEVAARLLEQHNPEEIATFIEEIPHTYTIPLLKYALPSRSARWLAALSVENSTGLLSRLPVTQCVANLRFFSKTQRKNILQKMPTGMQVSCKLLLSYSEDMVGAWMSPYVLTIPHDVTGVEALNYIKSENNPPSGIAYVIDRNRQLQGQILITQLLATDSNIPVDSLMTPSPRPLNSRSLVRQALERSEWGRHEALPVVNKSQQLIGVLRHLDLRRSLEVDISAPVNLPNPSSSSPPFTGLIKVYMHSLNTLGQILKNCIKTDLRS